MARPLKKPYRAINDLPIEMQSLVAALDSEYRRKKSGNRDIFNEESLFGAYAIAHCNARRFVDDDSFDRYNERAVEQHDKLVNRLAKRIAKQEALADVHPPLEIFGGSDSDFDDPTPEQLAAIEAMNLEAAAGEKKPPTAAQTEKATNIVSDFATQLSAISISVRRRR